MTWKVKESSTHIHIVITHAQAYQTKIRLQGGVMVFVVSRLGIRNILKLYDICVRQFSLIKCEK